VPGGRKGGASDSAIRTAPNKLRATIPPRPEPFQQPSVGRANRAISAHELREGNLMNGLIYLVGLIVVIMAILSLFGLR
jgi:hypothetical protein